LSSKQDTYRKPGPKGARLKIEGDWKKAVKKALEVERPADGWPDPDNRKKGRKAKKPAGDR